MLNRFKVTTEIMSILQSCQIFLRIHGIPLIIILVEDVGLSQGTLQQQMQCYYSRIKRPTPIIFH